MFANSKSYEQCSKSYVQIINTELAEKIGLEESVMVMQLHYWLTKCPKHKDQRDWIYNTLEDWYDQFKYWSYSKVRRIVKSLESSGVIISEKRNVYLGNHTKWYTINYELLNDTTGVNLLSQSSINDVNKNFTNFKMNKSFVQNEQIYIYTKNNLTNTTSSKAAIQQSTINKNTKRRRFFKSDSLVEKCVNRPLATTLHNEMSYTEEEKSIAKEMVNIWNEIFKHSLSPIKAYYNKQNIEKLSQIFEKYFDSDVQKWRNYALKVNSSKFLMGEKSTKTNFKAVFPWLIKDETIEEILGGGYGVGDRELDQNNISSNVTKYTEEIIKQANTKLLDHVKNTVDELKITKEFESYILAQQYEKDGDPYQMHDYCRHNPPYSIVHMKNLKPQYKSSYDFLYKKYLMGKYLKCAPIEFDKYVKTMINETINQNPPSNKIRSLSNLSNHITYFDFNKHVESTSATLFLESFVRDEENFTSKENERFITF